MHALWAVSEKIDAAYRSPAPTAQNAKQAGAYLAKCFNAGLGRDVPAFSEEWRGSMAYVGEPRGEPIEGPLGLVHAAAHTPERSKEGLICCFFGRRKSQRRRASAGICHERRVALDARVEGELVGGTSACD